LIYELNSLLSINITILIVVFNSEPANGTWRLWVEDNQGASQTISITPTVANRTVYCKNWFDRRGTECSWYGITCDDNEMHVTEIELDWNNLVITN